MRRRLSRALAELGVAAFLLAAPSLLVGQSYIAGAVLERRGAGFVPVAGAIVEARLAGGDGGEVVARVESGSFGRYFLGGLPAGQIEVTATHLRYYVPQTDPAGAAGAGETAMSCPGSGLCAHLDFEMLPAGELDVAVVDSLGAPIEGASVRVRRLDQAWRTIGPTVRAAGGVFHVTGLVPGEYEVEAEALERRGVLYHRAASKLSFRQGQGRETVRVVMPSERLYRLSGRIVGLDQEDAPQMLIVLEREQKQVGERPARLGAPVEPSGYFAVNRVPGGRFLVRLVWSRGSRLDLANGPSRLLGSIPVDGDLAGLVFAVPADLGMQ